MPSITCARCGGLNFHTDRDVCHRCEPSSLPVSGTASAAALAEASATHGATLYRRVLEQQRRGASAPKAKDAGSGGVVVATAEEKKPDIGAAPAAAAAPQTAPPAVATGFRSNKRPRAAGGGRDVIDLISSSDEGDDDNEDGEREHRREDDARKRQAAASDAPSHTNEVEQAAPAVRIPTPAPKDSASDADPDAEGAALAPPFRNRSFPVVPFNADDFVPLDGAAVVLRARKSQAAAESSDRSSPAAPSPQRSQATVQKTEPIPPSAPPAPVDPRVAVQEVPTRSQQQALPPPLSAATHAQHKENPAAPAPLTLASTPGLVNGSAEADSLPSDEPFQARMFESVEFNPRDFSTAHDGLNVARRSKPSAQSESREEQVEATQDEVETPAPSSSSGAPKAAASVVMPPTAVAPQQNPAPRVGVRDDKLVPPSPAVPAPQPASALSFRIPASAAPAPTSFRNGAFGAPIRFPLGVTAHRFVPRGPVPAPSTTTTTAITTTTTTTATTTPTHGQTTPQSSTSGSSSADPSSSSGATVLMPRKKTPQVTAPASTVIGSGSDVVRIPETESVAKVERAVHRLPVAIEPIAKPPLLGSCSAEFLNFMKDLVDGDEDEDETRKLHRQLLEVVDLTNLTDSSDDEDDDEDDDSDGYVISDPPAPTTATSLGVGVHPLIPSLHPGLSLPVANSSVTGFLAGPPRLPLSGTTTAGVAGVPVTPKLDQRRAARQLEPCVICEEKRWVRTMIQCKDCNKYYHKRCAKEYGDETICWNCELDGMIDDSELTETSRDEVIGMLSTLRPVSSEDEDDEDEDGEEGDGEENDGSRDGEPQTEEAAAARNSNGSSDESKTDEAGTSSTGGTRPAQFPGATTKAMQRWKAFLDVTTSSIDKSFNDVTNKITSELQSSELKAKYSKGFTTPEIFQAAISEVLDSYADLQDQLDREAREKTRATSAAEPTVAGAGPEAVVSDSSVPAPESASGSSGYFPAPPLAVLDLSRSSAAAVATEQRQQ